MSACKLVGSMQAMAMSVYSSAPRLAQDRGWPVLAKSFRSPIYILPTYWRVCQDPFLEINPKQLSPIPVIHWLLLSFKTTSKSPCTQKIICWKSSQGSLMNYKNLSMIFRVFPIINLILREGVRVGMYVFFKNVTVNIKLALFILQGVQDFRRPFLPYSSGCCSTFGCISN